MSDGGHAFPNITPDMPVDGGPGMTLRDYFAGQALASIPLRGWDHISDGNKPAAWARLAYFVADAMLDEREADR